MRPVALILAVALAGCVSVEYVPLNDVAAAAKPPNCKIEVFATKLPARDYVELGILEGTGTAVSASLKDVLPEMKKKACAAGGDAIILSGSQRTTTTTGTLTPGAGGTVSTTEHLYANATVIRWQE